MSRRRAFSAARDFPVTVPSDEDEEEEEEEAEALPKNADTKKTVSTKPRIPAFRDFPSLCGSRHSEEAEKTKKPSPTRVKKNVPEQEHGRFNKNDSKKKKRDGGPRLDENTQEWSHGDVARERVRATLRLFHAICRSLVNEGNVGISVTASKILQEKGKYVNTGKRILGPVPGVEVGDEFQYWRELNIIGLHGQPMSGIDYVNHDGFILATSVVSSGMYDDELDNTDVLVYTGQGGNVIKKGNEKEPKDQVLKRGNLALKNSCEVKNPVRVILKSGSKDRNFDVFTYYGLYEVDEYWQEMGSHGGLVYKFQLRRIPGQAEVAWKELKKSQAVKMRKGLCVHDISNGKEVIPICAVNNVDDEGLPFFEYITRMVYPNWCNPIPPLGCDCVDGCSDEKDCSCAVRNGGKIPFNKNRAILFAKSMVYECGPSCNCPSSCHNRVSQNGIRFRFEIFKTKAKGWGVRSHHSIPSGSFICEYTGELLEDAEAEQRIDNDEYLFDIGNNHSDNTLREELSTIVADAGASSSQYFEDGGFAIDAAKCGNLGRFINHSCSPNLFAQNVLYDHDDNRIPHIMLFAAENIPRMQELTYHYNYKIDQVYDSHGNVKKKNCYCGAPDCTGRMY